DVLAERDGQMRARILKFVRFEDLPQADHIPLVVGNLDADGRLARNSFNENGFRLQAEAQIFCEGGDATVLDSRVGFEFKRSHHRTGVDLYYGSEDIELFELRLHSGGRVLQLQLVKLASKRGLVEQLRCWQVKDRMRRGLGWRLLDVGRR